MIDTVLRYCEKEKLIQAGDCVLVGLSGGADSLCLLLVLKELQEKLAFSLSAVHVEHGIRGAESMEDASFVKHLCEKSGIPLQIFHVKALDYAKERKLGVEEAARELRYECYGKAVKSFEAPVKIALAHHADDNAETILFQMIRGSGLDGLCGMQARRRLGEDLEVIRPLLKVTRSEIEAYLSQLEQAYRIDSTNQEEVYSRNRIRRQVLPVLQEINTQAVSHINQSAEFLSELKAYIEGELAVREKEVLQNRTEGLCILKEPYEKLPAFVQKELLHTAIVRAAGRAKDIGMNHVRLLEELFSLQVGRSISLPYELTAKRVYEGIELRKGAKELPKSVSVTLEKEFLKKRLQEGAYEIPLSEGSLIFRLREETVESGKILKNTYTKWFDYDKIEGNLEIRTRQTGDYLVIDDAGHRKSLKEYFINEKIPESRRDSMILLADGEKVLWVLGCRISADVKVDDRTKRILEAQWIRNEEDYK